VAGKAGREGGRLALWFLWREETRGTSGATLARERGREAFCSAYINNKEMDPAATTLINGGFFWPIINGQATLASSFSLYK
jgi:hypothetical protein